MDELRQRRKRHQHADPDRAQRAADYEQQRPPEAHAPSEQREALDRTLDGIELSGKWRGCRTARPHVTPQTAEDIILVRNPFCADKTAREIRVDRPALCG